MIVPILTAVEWIARFGAKAGFPPLSVITGVGLILVGGSLVPLSSVSLIMDVRALNQIWNNWHPSKPLNYLVAVIHLFGSLLYTKLEPTTTKDLAHSFLRDLSEKHGVGDIVFLVNGSHSLQDVCQRPGFDFRYEKRGNRNAVERVFREIKRRAFCFSNCSSNAEAETADD